VCTQTDAGVAGACVGTNPVVCTASDQCHTAGTCDPATGACTNPAQADGTPCTDGNACTQTDTCAAGVCVGTNPVVCTASDQCHTAGTCDPATGACSNPAHADGKHCSDGNACTHLNACTYDSCGGGVCDNPPIEGCTPCTTATAATDCDDQDACTTDSCVSGVCSYQTIRPCKPCTTPGTCSDGNACTTDTCDSGVCHNTAIAGCVPCTSSAFCNDFNACTSDSCTGGVCVHTYTYSSTCLGPDASSPEICGNCIDDDNNGLTDFEDPACCLQSSTFTMKLKEGRLHPHGATTRLALRTVLARSGLAVNPLDHHVLLQTRPEGGTDVFCAPMPAADFTA